MKNLTITIGSLLISLILISCSENIEFKDSIMDMNNPTYLLEKSGPWDITEYNYAIIYSDTSLRKDLDSLALLHLSYIEHVTKLAGMSSSEMDSMSKFKVWLFKNDEDKYRKTQLHGIHCINDYFAVYYPAEESKSAHEYGHLVAYHNWGFMSNNNYSLFLDESFAYYVDEGNAFKFNYEDKAKEILDNNGYALSKILAGEEPFELFTNRGKKKAFVCATFIKYLVNKYGSARFGELWQGVKKIDKAAFKEVYQKEFEELEQDFYKYLKIEV